MNDCSSRSSSSGCSNISNSSNHNTNYADAGNPLVSANLTNDAAKNKKLFPKKLWDLINNEKYYFCLRWSDDGQLVYLNRDEFEESYLKTPENQFHTQKAISFVRQMNMYGFRKVDDCYYENDNFKRDCEYLLKNMIRKHPNKNHIPLLRQTQLVSDDPMASKQMFLSNASTMKTQNGSMSLSVDAGNAGHQTTNIETNHLVSEHNGPDFRTFYALLSSLSSNLCPTYQRGPLSDQTSGELPPPYQLYQSLVAQQHEGGNLRLNPTIDTTTKDLFTHSPGLPISRPVQMGPRWTSSHNLSDRTASATSLLTSSASVSVNNNSSDTADDLSLKNSKAPKHHHLDSQASTITFNQLRCSSPSDNNSSTSTSTSTSSLLQQPTRYTSGKYETASGSPISLTRRRDQRTGRPFKRSVDSILNLNETIGKHRSERISDALERQSNKRMKLDFCQAKDKQGPINLVGGVNELAKNLVSEIAQSRDAHLDTKVLIEASKYTESFVRTLFDTALVIARHSNGLNLSDYMLTADAANCQPGILKDPDDEDTFHQELERSNISVSDLNSALKLLPSKLLKILQ